MYPAGRLDTAVADHKKEPKTRKLRPWYPLEIPPRASRFLGVKTLKNKKGSQDKISQPLELYGRDGVIRTLDP
jgi:hypothetical protein